MAKQIQIASTPNMVNKPQPAFRKEELEVAIFSFGFYVLHEKAIKCPCKGLNTNQQSNCKNCGGTGWAFINPTQTRMLLHSMNLSNQYKEWSEELTGTVSITARDVEELTTMDRITIMKTCNGEEMGAVFNEVRHVREAGDDLFVFTTYNVLRVIYAGMFLSVNSPYIRLEEGVDFQFEENSNKILFGESVKEAFANNTAKDISITFRYKYLPQFHVIDVNREVSGSFTKIGNVEKQITLPVHAVGRRAHYILDADNFEGGRIIDNSFKEQC